MRALIFLGTSTLVVVFAGFSLVQGRSSWLRLAAISARGARVAPDPAAAGSGQASAGFESEHSIFANGVLEGRQRELSMRFEISGRLLAVRVEEGERVREGDLLAALDPATCKADLAKAEAALARARAELDLLLAGAREEVRENLRAQSRLANAELVRSRRHFERVSELKRQNVSAGQELDDSRAAFEAAQARYDAALAVQQEAESPARAEELRIAQANVALEEANVQQALTALGKTELRSPLDGLVLQRRGEPGELVGPATEQPLVTLADASDRYVRAFVEELDAPRVALGNRAFIQADGIRDTQFRGKVVSCAPYMAAKQQYRNRPNERLDVKTREVLIRLDDADRPARLMIGLPVDVRIQPTAVRD